MAHFVNSTSQLKLLIMRFIPTKVHGVMDYLMGILLIASPWLFDFNRGGMETWIPVILGVGAIVYSVMTDYELGLTRTLSMSTHLTLDLVSGILLALSPWIFGFADYVYMPHLVLGIIEIGASLMTKRESSKEGREHRGRGMAHSH
jgi:hypothetical protein